MLEHLASCRGSCTGLSPCRRREQTVSRTTLGFIREIGTLCLDTRTLAPRSFEPSPGAGASLSVDVRGDLHANDLVRVGDLAVIGLVALL
jgi:hypothetical protein